jgi:putative transposase
VTLGADAAGLSTRRYPVDLEPVGEAATASARSTSKSAVSRKFVAMTETALAEPLAADLSALDLVALTIDGVHFGESVCVAALGIDEQGTEDPVALVEGSTENATVVCGLLTGLRERGLDVTRPILVGIDGDNALRKAVVDVFDFPVIQRCQLHKIRNVQDRLPQRLRGPIGTKMRTAYHADSALEAEAQLTALAAAGQDPPRRRGQAARGPGRDPHHAAPGRAPDAGPHAALDQRHREHDLDLPDPLGQRQALARRADGAALVRRRAAPRRGRLGSSAGRCQPPRAVERRGQPCGLYNKYIVGPQLTRVTRAHSVRAG